MHLEAVDRFGTTVCCAEVQHFSLTKKRRGGGGTYEFIHSVEIEYPSMSDVIQRVPLPLLIKNLTFFSPDFSHLPTIACPITIIVDVVVVDVIINLPAGFSSFAHGFFVIFGVCEIECCEEGGVESVYCGTEGGAEGLPG